eukprot:5253418-Pyramimonas_sp.AAC.3
MNRARHGKVLLTTHGLATTRTSSTAPPRCRTATGPPDPTAGTAPGTTARPAGAPGLARARSTPGRRRNIPHRLSRSAIQLVGGARWRTRRAGRGCPPPGTTSARRPLACGSGARPGWPCDCTARVMYRHRSNEPNNEDRKIERTKQRGP